MLKFILLAGLAYVAIRTYLILPLKRTGKLIVLGLFVAAMLAFACSITGLIEHMPMWMAGLMYNFGCSWLIFFMYVLLFFVLLDLLHLMGVLPDKILKHSVVGTALVFGVTLVLLTYGAIHYKHKYREEITVETPKIEAPLKIVMMSDLHLGYHNRRAELSRWVDMINAEQPDMVLIAGDIIDRSIRAVTADGDSSEFKRLQAPVYACLGNHEYYAGEPDSEAFYKEAGITLLKDSLASVCGITVVGRDDAGNEQRRHLTRIIKKVPSDSYKILIDHQPNNLLDSQLAGFDFQFSGHTHNGQVWPMNWIVRLKFEKSYGYLTKGATHYYITSGLGLWGGKFRIGTRSEYVVLNLKPAEQLQLK